MWMTLADAAEAVGCGRNTLAARRRCGSVWCRPVVAGRCEYWIDDIQREVADPRDVTATRYRSIGPMPPGAIPIAWRDPSTGDYVRGKTASEPPPEQPRPHRPDLSTTSDDPDTRYYSEVDSITRRVICYAPQWKRPKVISFDDDIALHRAYSSAGEGMQVRQIATRMGWTVDSVRAVLRARGLTHASPMWPEWEQDERGDEDLLEDQRAIRLQRIAAKADRQRVRELERAEERQRAIEEWTREVLTPYTRPEPRPTRYTLRDDRPPAYIVDAMTDVHVEAMGWDGTGHEEKIRDVLAVTDRLIVAAMRSYTPERVAIIVGSDWLDADRYDGATTKGTPQHASLPRVDVARVAIDLLRERVRRWRSIAPVDLCIVPGNHDRELTAWLRVWCEDTYRDAPDVRILHHPSGRVYVRHGACLIGVTHGDTAKSAQLPGLMADEAPEQSGVAHRHWIIGHLHRYEVSERAGGSVTTAPAMTKPNPWALQHFGAGRRAAVALAYHAERGHCATFVERP